MVKLRVNGARSGPETAVRMGEKQYPESLPQLDPHPWCPVYSHLVQELRISPPQTGNFVILLIVMVLITALKTAVIIRPDVW